MDTAYEILISVQTFMEEKITLETTITVKQAYLSMFEYLDRYWESYNRPNEVGMILSNLSLWDSVEGKRPMDASIFPEWLNCVAKVLSEGDGYDNADIKLTR